ncbi:MAG TPA: hypothetical protein VN688_03940 [Gemmataceae bacterium]|nr:hypothetical protein [Gemmataceae bacterium]
MSLNEILLEKLANWRPDNDRQTLDVADAASGWRAAVTADCVDVVGCRLWELTLRRSTPTPLVDLKLHAEQIGQRVTGLLEPLRLLEVDNGRNVALLRSEQPGQRGDERFYYEVLLEGDGSAVLRRYQAPRPAEPRRQQVAFTLTHETLAKLVGDLTASV